MPTVSANGATIYYEDGGSGDRTILFIPGGGGTVEGWADYRAALEPRARVITMDNRGAGRSTPPDGDYTIGDMADDAAAVLDDAGVPTASVVGVSLGGAVAQELALRHPDRVERLVLISTIPQTGPEAGPFLRPMWDLLEAIDDAGLEVDRSIVMLPIMASRKTLANEEFVKQYVAMQAQNLAPHSPADGKPKVWGQVNALRSFYSLDRLPTLSCPTLVLVGADDIHTTPRQAELMAEAIPGARLEVVPDAGHLLIRERPEEVMRLLAEVLLDGDVVRA